MQISDILREDMQILLRIAVAMLLGAVVGLDRELEGKPAGLRTHMLVAGGAGLFVVIAETLVTHYIERFSMSQVSTDPVRILEAVITGISFLGAGTIIHYGPDRGVEGLTTAASVLFTAGLGPMVMLGRMQLAIGATLLVFLTLRGLGFIERKVFHRPSQ